MGVAGLLGEIVGAGIAAAATRRGGSVGAVVPGAVRDGGRGWPDARGLRSVQDDVSGRPGP